jgi:CoA:oxalate CoA-transferase
MAGTYVVDYSTGLYATIGTLGALQTRERTGAGQVVEVALLDAALSMLMSAIPEQRLLGRSMSRNGNRDRYGAPANTFPTRDGAWVHLASAGEPMFRALAAVMGRPDLAADPRFSDNEARLRNVDALEEIIATWTRAQSAAELLDALRAIGVPSAKVAGIAELVNDAHLAAGERVIEMQHATAGTVPMQGFAVRFGASPMRLRYPAPTLGQHTAEVLNEWLGLGDGAVSALRQAGVV